MYDKVRGFNKPPFIAEDTFLVIAGPCSVEDEKTMLAIAKHLVRLGITYMRAGAYKPRTSPYSFQGLEEEGLAILGRIKAQTGIKIVSEIIDAAQIPSYEANVDIIQVGARNMQNFALLKALGKVNKPVLLKRGFGATIEEWLYACEHLLVAGNDNIILCERGIKTFEPSTRTTLDLSSVPIVKRETRLSIVVDPSHSSGRSDLVLPLSKAGLAVGADGLMIEVHISPEAALSDAQETLNIDEFEALLEELKIIATVLGKRII